MKTVKITYENGVEWLTQMSGTAKEIKDYFTGSFYNFGDTEENQKDNLVRVKKIEVRS